MEPMRTALWLYRLVVALGCVAVTAAYWAGIALAGSADAFVAAQLAPYAFATSLFDLWAFSLGRALVLGVGARRVPFAAVVTLALATLALVSAKAALLHAAGAIDYAVLALAALAAVADTASWKAVLHSKAAIYEIYAPDADVDGPTQAYRPAVHSSDPYKQPLLADYGIKASPRLGFGGSASVAPELVTSSSLPFHASTMDAAAVDGAAAVLEDDASFHSAVEDGGADGADVDASFIAQLEPQGSDGAAAQGALSTRPTFPDDRQAELEQMKAAFPDQPELRLKRFLAARNFDVAKGTAMLKDHLKWLEDTGFDKIQFPVAPVPMRGFDCFPDGNAEQAEDCFKRVVYYNGSVLHKWTRDGQPLSIYTFGATDAKGIVQNVTKEELEKVAIEALMFITTVVIPEMEKRTGPQPPALSAILDLHGLGYRQFYMPAIFHLTGLITLVERNFPECLGFVYVINAPAIFQMFWNIIKPFIPERSQHRFRILGSNFQKELLEQVAPENLPSYLGGLCCCRYEDGCVPYPRSPGYGNPRKDARGYWAVTVAQGKPTDQPISVTKEEIQRELRQHSDRKHVTIRWTFDCKQPQIRFSVLFMKGFNVKYMEDGTPLTTLVAPEDVDAQSKPVTGHLHVHQPGTYILRWENVASKKPLNLSYQVRE